MGEGLARAHESASAIKKTIGWEWLEARHGRMRVPVLKKKIGLEWVRARHEGVSAIIIKIKINKKYIQEQTKNNRLGMGKGPARADAGASAGFVHWYLSTTIWRVGR